MKLDKLLEYQAVDTELMKAETDFRSLPVCKEYFHTANILNNAKSAIKKLTGDADELSKQIETFIDQYSKLASMLEETEKEVEGINDIKESDFYVRSIEKLISEMQSLSKQISILSSKVDEHRLNYDKAIKQGKDATTKGRELTPEYQKAREEIKPIIEKLNKELVSLESKIDKIPLAHYKQLRAAKKTPAIVPLHGETSCGGCFMELAGNAKIKLKADGYIECPNCSRIIYIPEEK